MMKMKDLTQTRMCTDLYCAINNNNNNVLLYCYVYAVII